MKQTFYRFEVKVHSRRPKRGGGVQSALEAAAYRSASVLHRISDRSMAERMAYRSGGILNDQVGETFDYTRKHGVEWSMILAPPDAPKWVFDREMLWNTVDRIEKRVDARLAREFIVSLPRELSREQQQEIVRAFAGQHFISRGLVADINFHCPKASDEGEQPHVHIMLPDRQMTKDGFSRYKYREWNGRLTQKTFQDGQSRTYKSTDVILGWREEWAATLNRFFQQERLPYRVDHRSLKDQGYDLIPEPKIGKGKWSRKRSAEATERVREAHRENIRRMSDLEHRHRARVAQLRSETFMATRERRQRFDEIADVFRRTYSEPEKAMKRFFAQANRSGFENAYFTFLITPDSFGQSQLAAVERMLGRKAPKGHEQRAAKLAQAIPAMLERKKARQKTVVELLSGAATLEAVLQNFSRRHNRANLFERMIENTRHRSRGLERER